MPVMGLDLTLSEYTSKLIQYISEASEAYLLADDDDLETLSWRSYSGLTTSHKFVIRNETIFFVLVSPIIAQFEQTKSFTKTFSLAFVYILLKM